MGRFVKSSNNCADEIFKNRGTSILLFVLKPNMKMHYYAFVFICLILAFSILFVILPVIITANFNAVWPANDNNITYKIIVFCLSAYFVVSVPFLLPAFNKDKIYFYDDHLSVKPLYRKKAIMIYYDKMVVTVYGKYRIKIRSDTQYNNNSLFNYYKNHFLNGLSFSLLSSGWCNPEELPQVINILKNKSLIFRTKHLM